MAQVDAACAVPGGWSFVCPRSAATLAPDANFYAIGQAYMLYSVLFLRIIEQQVLKEESTMANDTLVANRV